MDFARLQRMADNLQKQKCVNTTKQRESLEQKTVGDKVTKQRPCVGNLHLSSHNSPDSSDTNNFVTFLMDNFAGILSAVDPAEDPVPTMHEEPAVRHPESEQEPVPVLSPQEMHRRRHEPGW